MTDSLLSLFSFVFVTFWSEHIIGFKPFVKKSEKFISKLATRNLPVMHTGSLQ